MKKSNVHSKVLLMVSVVLSERYSGGDHHWYEFLQGLGHILCMDFVESLLIRRTVFD